MKKQISDGLINGVDENEVLDALGIMESDPKYLTRSFYRGTSERWTDNYISFVEYHVNYLKTHASLNPRQYLSNLRLMLKKSPR